MNDAILTAASQVTRRCIRSTGREFEEGFSCPTDPALAEAAARAMARNLGYVCSPSVRQIGPAEFSVHYYGCD
jgi:hypothetical protein